MSNVRIVHQEMKVFSPEITVVWCWKDLTPQNPYYVFGTDPNPPFCCTYKNGQLVSTLQWSKEETLDTIERLLKEKPKYELMPVYSDCPCERQ